MCERMVCVLSDGPVQGMVLPIAQWSLGQAAAPPATLNRIKQQLTDHLYPVYIYINSALKHRGAKNLTSVRIFGSPVRELNHDLVLWGHVPLATLHTSTRINKFISSSSRQPHCNKCGKEVMRRRKTCEILTVATRSGMFSTLNFYWNSILREQLIQDLPYQTVLPFS